MSTQIVTRQAQLQNWALIIRNCKESGLSVPAFCSQNGISKHAYYYWYKKVKTKLYAQNSFVEISPTAQVPEGIPVEKESADTLIEAVNFSGRCMVYHLQELEKLRPLLEKYDVEHIFCAVDLDEKIAMLEAKLHSAEDPEEIAKETLVSAVEFYDGDWCGIIEADLEMESWCPVLWYDRETGGMTELSFVT